MVPRLILDCDPGDDDALAILVASRFADIQAITTVAGNAAVEDTTRNALRVVEVLGLDVAVHAGCARPMNGSEVERPSTIHGAHGFGGGPYPEPTRRASASHAVDALTQLLRTLDDVTLVATGPLTNVATAFERAPDIVARIRDLVIMGGTIDVGNRSPVAEANVWTDPEAAAIVFDAPVKKTMIGLHITRRVVFEPTDRAVLAQTADPVAAFYANLLRHTLKAYERTTGQPRRPLHDPCAVLAVTHPHLFTFERHRVRVELDGRWTRGMTVIDRRTAAGTPAGGDVDVAMDVDAEACRRTILDAIRAERRS